jgi:hypothetical protein
MPREAGLFETAKGNSLRGYLLMKQSGANLPPMWIARAETSRKRRQRRVADILKNGGVAEILDLEDWDVAYQKECFYRGIRILFDLERKGRTRM